MVKPTRRVLSSTRNAVKLRAKRAAERLEIEEALTRIRALKKSLKRHGPR